MINLSKVLELLLLLVLCNCRLAVKLNLNESCSNTETYYCTLEHIEASMDEPILWVEDAPAQQLLELIIHDSAIERVPHDLFGLAPALRSFCMHNCGLSKLYPGDFAKAALLRLLVLQHNHFYEIPTNIFDGIRRLQNLQLGNNDITRVDPKAFAGLVELRYLDMQQNQIEELDEELFKDLTVLEHLDLSGNKIQKITERTFAANKFISILILANNQFTVFEPNSLMQFHHLNLLDVSACTLDELELKTVDTLLAQNSGLKKCSFLGPVIKVHAGNNQLESVTFGDRSHTRELDLHGNQITSLNAFMEMSNLQHLDVSKNQLKTLKTSKSPLFLRLPSLKHLNLAGNQLTNLSVEQFVLVQKLTHLDLSHNEIHQLNQNVFEPLAHLEKLYLEGNGLQNFDYEQFLVTHPLLKEIGLFDNNWDFHLKRNLATFFRNHGVKLIAPFGENTALEMHSTTAASTTAHHRHYAATTTSGNAGLDVLEEMRLHQQKLGSVTGIHPYWTKRDILTLVTLLFVLVILVLQLWRILQEEQCFVWCWRRHGEAETETNAAHRHHRFDREDSEV